MNFVEIIGLFFTLCLISCNVSGKPDYSHPKVPLSTANNQFRKCCEHSSDIPQKCWKLCKYDVSLSEATDAYKRGDCDVEMLEPYLRCANGANGKGSDNRQCCKDLGVMNSLTDPLCSQFCAKNPTLDHLKEKQMKCARRMKEVMKCHNYGLKP